MAAKSEISLTGPLWNKTANPILASKSCENRNQGPSARLRGIVKITQPVA